MNAREEIEGNRPTRATFSLPFLFRIMSLVALAIAWPLWIATMPPHTIMMLFAGMGFVLAIIVGYRRSGTAFIRAGAAVAFFSCSVVVGFYSATVALMWQGHPEQSHPFDDLGIELGGALLLFALPWILGILLLLLRAWTWSAHDKMTYGQKEIAKAPDDDEI